MIDEFEYNIVEVIIMSINNKTVRYTATLPEESLKELKALADSKKIPSVNFAIKEAVADYLKQIKKSEYEELMFEAGKDKEFLERTTNCEEDFKAIASEVHGEW